VYYTKRVLYYQVPQVRQILHQIPLPGPSTRSLYQVPLPGPSTRSLWTKCLWSIKRVLYYAYHHHQYTDTINELINEVWYKTPIQDPHSFAKSAPTSTFRA